MQQGEPKPEQVSYLIKDQFKIVKKIGMGSFGQIYLCADIKTKDRFAIKIEKQQDTPEANLNPNKNLLMKEKTIMQLLAGCPDYPRYRDFGEQDNCNYLIMTYLGLNMDKLMAQQPQKRFSLKSGLQIGIQMVQRIRVFHDKDYVHRDIKPENFVIGNEENGATVYLIDYGLAKKYREGGQHVRFVQRKGLVGTARYTSVNAHDGIEQSRRDDLMSISYLIVYFLNGKLPWQNLPIKNTEEKFKKIAYMKKNITPQELCKGLPPQLEKVFSHISGLGFDQAPDYDYLIQQLKEAMQEKHLRWDNHFEWWPIRPDEPSIDMATDDALDGLNTYSLPQYQLVPKFMKHIHEKYKGFFDYKASTKKGLPVSSNQQFYKQTFSKGRSGQAL